MKKLVALFLSLSAIFSFTLPANAVSLEPNLASQTYSSSEYTISEYDYIASMDALSDQELADLGYTSENIKIIRNADSVLDNEIERLNTLPDANLATLGYSDEQIDLIRTYNPETATAAERSLLGGNCDVTVTIDNYTGTTGRVTTEFVWTTQPAFKMIDILATSWNNWYITGKSANIEYANINGTNDTFWEAPTYFLPDNNLESNGSGYKFNAAKQDNQYYSRSGYSIFVLRCQSRQHLEAGGALGHQQGTAELSFSIDGVTINFTIGRVSADFDRDIVGNT